MTVSIAISHSWPSSLAGHSPRSSS
jgi:hypothetical protein